IASLFKSHFAPVTEMHLEMNYRFDQNILAAIKSFLTSMEGRTTKNIESDRLDDGEKKCIKVFGGYNLAEEAGWVIDRIKNIREEDEGASVAVLARSNFVINKLADVFTEKKMAHMTVDKYDFFRRQEVKDVFAYLKILFNKYDLESAYRIVTRPARNIGEVTLKKIREEGGASGLRVSDFLDFKNFNYPEPFSNLINKWEKGRLIVLDTETTGINPLRDEVIQIYATEVVDGKLGKDFEFLLKNTKPVGLSGEVHGFTDEYLAEKGRDPKEVLQELKDFIGNDITIGHNVNFDLSMLLENGKRHDVLFEFKEYYDTLDLARRLVESENYKLGTLVKKFGLSQATHDAKDDVLATVGLLEVLVGKLMVSRTERATLFAKFSGKFVKLAGDINTWQKEIKKLRPVDALDYIWEQSGLQGFYNEQKDKDKRLKSIEVLRDVFQTRDDAERPAETVLRELINYAALTRDINFLGVDSGKVPIVTVHQVKGLEFDYVFVVGLNEFKFPMYRSDVAEEKRLFYVALTRAKKRIYLSYSRFDDYNRNLAISPFIGYLDGDYIETI
ncbi:ATP-binding domain-containing protein, partial [Patescibacteria group bacterium]|nr:ATP-binding domain-containing protein [Patescibacteria group bacterium]